jgi:hypothetical protein
MDPDPPTLFASIFLKNGMKPYENSKQPPILLGEKAQALSVLDISQLVFLITFLV